jgi:ribosomal protein S27E
MEDSFIQKFFKAILPQKPADNMEAESRSWMLQCSDCKHERSFGKWAGRARGWKAAGSPRMYRHCPNCGKTILADGLSKSLVNI